MHRLYATRRMYVSSARLVAVLACTGGGRGRGRGRDGPPSNTASAPSLATSTRQQLYTTASYHTT